MIPAITASTITQMITVAIFGKIDDSITVHMLSVESDPHLFGQGVRFMIRSKQQI